MKKCIIIIVILYSSITLAQNQIYFAGYQNKFPVFTDDNDKPFLYKNGVFQPLDLSIDGYLLVYMNDKKKLIRHNTKREYYIDKNGVKTLIEMGDVWDYNVSVSYDSICYVYGDIDNEKGVKYNEIMFYNIKTKKKIAAGVRGLSPFIIENYLYFMTYSIKDPQESTYATVNLKRCKIGHPNQVENIVDTISRSDIYIIPGNKYLVSLVQRRDATTYYSVYNIQTKKWALLDKTTKGNFDVFWDYVSNKICIFDYTETALDFYTIPSFFPNKKSDKKVVFFDKNGKPKP